jgi:uncharacterized protein
LIALQWSFIFAGALLLLWAPGQRWLAAGSLVIGYALALGNGQLDAIAFVPVLLLVGAASGLASQQKLPVLILAHLSFVLLALALFLHWLPGFHNQRVIGPERLTPDAVPYSMSLNYLTRPYQPSPKEASGRPAHRPFLGLLGVHSRCGLPIRAVT